MPKLLIVDDDRTMVKLLTTLLEMDGFEISVTGRGADVLPLVQQQSPDGVLLDYHLSDIDGVEVVRTLRALPQYATLPIVMASGLDVEHEALKAGATRFLLKPYQPDDLTAIFTELIGG